MTMVVGFRFADEAIFGADSRRIEQRTGIQHDDTEKVFDCALGLVAAAGELNTIRLVMTAICFAGDSPADAVGPTLLRLVPDPNDAARLSTQWLATSSTADGDGVEVNMSLVSLATNFQAVAVEDGAYRILYPAGITQAQKTTVETALDASLAEALGADDAGERREIVFNAIHTAITTVAAHNTGVSARIQVGVHDSQGNIRVSNIGATVAELEFPVE